MVVTGDGEDAVFVEKAEGSASGSLGSVGRLLECLRGSHGGQADPRINGGEELGRRTDLLAAAVGTIPPAAGVVVEQYRPR